VIGQDNGLSIVEYSFAGQEQTVVLAGDPPRTRDGRITAYYNTEDPRQVLYRENPGYEKAHGAAWITDVQPDSYRLTYSFREFGTATLPGTLKRDETIGSNIAVTYEVSNPANISRSTWSLSDDFAIIATLLIVGSVLAFLGFKLERTRFGGEGAELVVKSKEL